MLQTWELEPYLASWTQKERKGRLLMPAGSYYHENADTQVIEKECLAIVWALKLFHVYLYGQAFTLQTDHKPLSWLNHMQNSNSQLTRWSLVIQPYRMLMEKGMAMLTNSLEDLRMTAVLTQRAILDSHREGGGMSQSHATSQFTVSLSCHFTDSRVF